MKRTLLWIAGVVAALSLLSIFVPEENGGPDAIDGELSALYEITCTPGSTIRRTLQSTRYQGGFSSSWELVPLLSWPDYIASVPEGLPDYRMHDSTSSSVTWNRVIRQDVLVVRIERSDSASGILVTVLGYPY